MDEQAKLLIIITDRLDVLVTKGEITDRYYNPGDLFDEVHILSPRGDTARSEDIQKAVGKAKVYLYPVLPGLPSFKKTFGWSKFLLKEWAETIIALVRQINPQLIRVYGNNINGYLAAQIKKSLDVPLVVSMHTHPDESWRERISWRKNFRTRLLAEFNKIFEKETLRNSDCTIAVYESIVEYVRRFGAKRIELIYNVINPTHLRQKTNYKLHFPPRIISVGRQFPGKCPDNLIRAIASLDVELTMVGNGEYHDYLKGVAKECNVENQVIFKPSVSNDTLCNMLADYDIFATHSDYWGIPKAVMEPLLIGLPVVINYRYPKPIPELNSDWVMLVKNTKEGYLNALKQLLTDDNFRESIGRRGYDFAWKTFPPDKMEQKVVDLYRELVPNL